MIFNVLFTDTTLKDLYYAHENTNKSFISLSHRKFLNKYLRNWKTAKTILIQISKKPLYKQIYQIIWKTIFHKIDKNILEGNKILLSRGFTFHVCVFTFVEVFCY